MSPGRATGADGALGGEGVQGHHSIPFKPRQRAESVRGSVLPKNQWCVCGVLGVCPGPVRAVGAAESAVYGMSCAACDGAAAVEGLRRSGGR